MPRTSRTKGWKKSEGADNVTRPSASLLRAAADQALQTVTALRQPVPRESGGLAGEPRSEGREQGPAGRLSSESLGALWAPALPPPAHLPQALPRRPGRGAGLPPPLSGPGPPSLRPGARHPLRLGGTGVWGAPWDPGQGGARPGPEEPGRARTGARGLSPAAPAAAPSGRPGCSPGQGVGLGWGRCWSLIMATGWRPGHLLARRQTAALVESVNHPGRSYAATQGRFWI